MPSSYVPEFPWCAPCALDRVLRHRRPRAQSFATPPASPRRRPTEGARPLGALAKMPRGPGNSPACLRRARPKRRVQKSAKEIMTSPPASTDGRARIAHGNPAYAHAERLASPEPATESCRLRTRRHHMLPTKLDAAKPTVPKRVPEDALRRRRSLPHLASKVKE